MWEKVRLEDICGINMGKTPSRNVSDYWNGEYPWVSIADLKGDYYIKKTKEKISAKAVKESGIKVVPKNTLLYSFKLSIGKVAITENEIYTNEAIVALPIKDNSRILLSYLYWAIQVIDLTGIGDTAVMGLTLNKEKLKNLEIPLPPLPIQKRIAEILDTADALRRKDEALLKKYDELAQAIFIDMFGDPVKNEKGWEIKKLGDITSLITDGKHGNCNDEDTSGYYFISAKDIFDEKIHYSNARQIPRNEFEEVDRRTNLQSGDIVMVNTGATIGKLAIAKDIPETRKTTFQKSVAVIKLKPEFITNYFLKYVFLLRINSFANKGTGSAVQNLLLSEMREFKIILPKTTLQNSFTEKIKNLEEQKSILQSSLNKKSNLFNSLLQKAFNGELVA